jgi:hypothetical protein
MQVGLEEAMLEEGARKSSFPGGAGYLSASLGGTSGLPDRPLTTRETNMLAGILENTHKVRKLRSGVFREPIFCLSGMKYVILYL